MGSTFHFLMNFPAMVLSCSGVSVITSCPALGISSRYALQIFFVNIFMMRTHKKYLLRNAKILDCVYNV